MSASTQTPEPRELTVTYSGGDRVFRGIVTAGAFTSLIVLGLIGLFFVLRSSEIFRDLDLSSSPDPTGMRGAQTERSQQYLELVRC